MPKFDCMVKFSHVVFLFCKLFGLTVEYSVFWFSIYLVFWIWSNRPAQKKVLKLRFWLTVFSNDKCLEDLFSPVWVGGKYKLIFRLVLHSQGSEGPSISKQTLGFLYMSPVTPVFHTEETVSIGLKNDSVTYMSPVSPIFHIITS